MSLGWFDSPKEKDRRDRERAAEKSGGSANDYKPCPDDCNGGYVKGFRCRRCGGEGTVRK